MLGCFGHSVFLMLHGFAIMLGFIGLFITIPAHLVFAAILHKRK